jgi:FkbM family methyltransferase
MSSFGRPLARLTAILSTPKYWKPALRGTAASFEHEAVVAFIAPATVIDVGANEGQFALAARVAAPQAQIIAFEPLIEAAVVFRKNFARDPRTRLERAALASQTESATIYVTNRADSSSILKPGEAQAEVFSVREVRQISVQTRRLDDILRADELDAPCMLKLDVQGAELRVLEGAGDLLESVSHVYVETSFTTLYEGQPLFRDIYDFLTAKRFAFAGALNTTFHKRFGPVQCDCLFIRRGDLTP